MLRSLSLAVLAGLFACLFLPAAQAGDLQALEGTWRAQTAETGGQQIESDGLKDIVVTITGDHYTAKTNDHVDTGTLKLDETQKPRTLDATKTEGTDAGEVTKAIYELSGDTLRVCYATDGSERPTELVTKDGSSWLLVTYKREK